jgi:hypothetical protein
MSIIILIPCIVCIVFLVRRGTQLAFLDVCLPTLMLLPTYYEWKAPLLPPITFLQAAMVPLGIAMVLGRRWRISRTDLWMGLFIFTTGYADYKAGRPTASTFAIYRAIATGLFPYMAGKLLIEQPGARVATARRYVWLLFIVSFPSMYEYFMKSNIFLYFWSHFFHDWPGWVTQIRWGFGRVAGPYAQSELAGMVIFTGLMLTLWLSTWHYWEPQFKHMRWIRAKKATIITCTLVLLLYMGQARGPWFGSILAWCVAFIGRADKLLRRSLIVGGLILAIGIPGYIAAKHYLASPTTSDEQQTAQYRQELYTNYVPIAEKGGAWGWGADFPRTEGQISIDNEYLLLYLVQGYVGLAAFVLLILEAAFSLIRLGATARSRRDRHFCFSLLGILAGFVLTLGTVFLGAQPYTIFFILIGWSQAISWANREVATDAEPIRVYT